MTPLRACAGATILGTVVVFLHAAVAHTGSSPAYFPYPPAVIPADLDQEIQRVQGEVDQWQEPSEILVLALNRTTRHWNTHVCRGWQNPPCPPLSKGGFVTVDHVYESCVV
jgi:hypothetical protein